MNDSNITDENFTFSVPFFPFPFEEPAEWGFWTEQYATPVIAAIGITGNCLSFAVMKSKPLRRKSYSHLLCALAIFDSLTLIGREISLIDKLRMEHLKQRGIFEDFSDAACKAYHFLEHMCYLMSSWLLVSMAVERVQAVCLPFKKTILRTQTGAVTLISILFLVLAGTQIFRLIQFGKTNGRCAALPDHLQAFVYLHVYLYQVGLIFVLPFVIVLVCNSLVIYQIHTVRRAAGDTRSAVVARTHKTTYMLLFISFTYVITLLPLFVISAVVLAFARPSDPQGISLYFKLKPISEMFSVISYTNYGINFFIYVLSGKHFRRELNKILKREQTASTYGTRTRTKEEVMRLN